jgi:tellurite resistance protein
MARTARGVVSVAKVLAAVDGGSEAKKLTAWAPN